MPFVSGKRKKMGGQESETPGLQRRTNWWDIQPRNTMPHWRSGANNLDSVWREWSRQCHLYLTYSLSGQAPGGWVGSVGLPLSHPSAVPMRVHCRPHGAHCLQRSGHSAQRTGSLKLWRGRTLCASPWPALNCSCTFKESVAVAGEQRAMHARCNP